MQGSLANLELEAEIAAIAAAIRCGRSAVAAGRTTPPLLMAARLPNGALRGESPLLFPLLHGLL